jgi:hypothetical protein
MKTCTRCHTAKELIAFPEKGGSCRSCVSAKTKWHVLQNRASYDERRDSRIAEIRALKEQQACVVCHTQYPSYVLDYDHRDPFQKEFDISDAVKGHVAWSRILKEIEKCDLLCACCHRLRTQKPATTYEFRKKRVSNLQYVSALKTTTPCQDCGGLFAACQLDFDHVRGTKTNSISKLMDADRETLDQELAKCEIVCANCHRVRTWSQRLVCRSSSPIRFRSDQPDPRWWHSLVGTMSDRGVAIQAGLDPSSVGSYRKRLGMPAFQSRYTRKETRASA